MRSSKLLSFSSSISIHKQCSVSLLKCEKGPEKGCVDEVVQEGRWEGTKFGQQEKQQPISGQERCNINPNLSSV